MKIVTEANVNLIEQNKANFCPLLYITLAGAKVIQIEQNKTNFCPLLYITLALCWQQ
jgi:hypothetical protein